MRRIAMAAALLALASCQTMTPQERRAADEQTCRDYGFKKRNDAFAECLQRLDLYRKAQMRADQRRALDEMERDFWYRSRVPIVIHRRGR